MVTNSSRRPGFLGYEATFPQVPPQHLSVLSYPIFQERSGMLTFYLGVLLRLLYRHRVSNLLLTSVLPGPKEQTPDELQRFLRPVVNDLKRLWRDGISIQTPSCLPGESTYLILHHVCIHWPLQHD